MYTKPNELLKYSLEELRSMEFRELECHVFSWDRGIGHPEVTDEEAEYIRTANRIWFKRQEALRVAAPYLLISAKEALDFLKQLGYNGGYNTPGWRLEQAIDKAEDFK